MAPGDLARSVSLALSARSGVRVVWLFGSRVTGTATERSDLDVAVVYARELDDAARECERRAVVAALTDSLGALGERADVVDVDRAASGVGFKAIAEGVLALARSDAERVAATVRIARRYDDEAPRRALYRHAARRHAGAHGGRP